MSNLKNIQDFIEFKKVTNKSNSGKIRDSTVNKYKYNLTNYSNHINKDFKEVNEKELLDYLKRFGDSAKNSNIILLRSFYRYLYNLDENEKLPSFIRRIKATRIVKDEINYRERVITEKEYDKLLKYATQPIHKAIIETLWLTGGRRNAIQSIKSNGVFYDGKYTHVILWISKTKTREFIEPGRFEHLFLWVEEMQPFKKQENKPLFAVKIRGKKEEYKQVNEKYTNKFLKRICIKAKLRHITPHDFRHTKCTNLLKNGVPETHVKTLLGFTKDSNMLKVYDHNKLKDYEDWLKNKDIEIKPTYDLLEKQKKTLEEEYGRDINILKEKISELDGIIKDLGIYKNTDGNIFENQGIEGFEDIYQPRISKRKRGTDYYLVKQKDGKYKKMSKETC